LDSVKILSASIEHAVQIATASGNSIAEVSEGWRKVLQVVHMTLPLSADARRLILKVTGLRHWTTEATPHGKAEEGFTCDKDNVAMAFPRAHDQG
jgi:hypothetical protein